MKIRPERLAKGLYWDRAWRLVAGCTKVSPGCTNCWAEKEHNMRKNHPSGGMRKQYPSECDWSGKIVVLEQNLDKPVKTRKPAVWSVWNDLFHESVPFDFIASVFAATAKCPQHTFLILTKRPERAVEYFQGLDEQIIKDFTAQAVTGFILKPAIQKYYKNIWFGTTVENSDYLWRVEELLKINCAHRFVNLEPLLSEVELRRCHIEDCKYCRDTTKCLGDLGMLDWVIAGGETGKNARACHPDWVRKIQEDCAEAGVPFFFKQWGEWLHGSQTMITANKFSTFHNCVKEQFAKVGKKKAGRLLDGKEYLELPEG